MVHDLVFPEFLLGILLWLGIHLYLWWQCRSVRQPPAPRTDRRPKALKPFVGLTARPHCAACEQDQTSVGPPLPSPPPLIVPQRGRPRAVDTQTQYCPQKTCPYYGWMGRGNLRANGHPGSGFWRQLHCVVCDTYFLETHQTLFYGKPHPAERIVGVVAAL